ncbi:zinc finger protein 596-like [Spea bombifrons]|uniref:zinc finger protein 596-like n=1 Tax=Spea bombifrons TaxID=233779 RepID=UPI00234A4DB7|nr:zinc finger protein 596-like [Spea bombifrons]XP_053327243.1 zinc finger protein 596-like [Spea bombifrons]XP_053327244.1 zinc finger protein 596-like [Spea bombifrons]
MDLRKKDPCLQDNVDVLLIDSRGVPYTVKKKSNNSRSGRAQSRKCKKRNRCTTQANGENVTSNATEGKPLKCTYCGKLYKWPSHLRYHMQSHTNERPHKCTICSKSFKDVHKLARHQQTHTELGEDMADVKVHKCHVCDKPFKYRSDLDKHSFIHTGEKPFKCSLCSASFRRIDHLKRHNYIHTGDRPYKCSVCMKGFLEATELVKHERVHSGNKPYQCTLCNKSFSLSRSLKEHKIASHTVAELENALQDTSYRITASKDRSPNSEAALKTEQEQLDIRIVEFSSAGSLNVITVCLSDDDSDLDTFKKDN